MAKGLRSSSKVRFRGIKREKIFKPIEDARLARLAKKQAEAARGPCVKDGIEVTEESKTNFGEQVPATEENGMSDYYYYYYLQGLPKIPSIFIASLISLKNESIRYHDRCRDGELNPEEYLYQWHEEQEKGAKTSKEEEE